MSLTVSPLPLKGEMALPSPRTATAGKPPIYLRLTDEALAALTFGTSPPVICIADGPSPVLRIGDDIHALDAIDDENPYDLFRKTDGGLVSLGTTSVRYMVRAEPTDLAAKTRGWTQADQRARHSPQVKSLDDSSSQRGSSRSPVIKVTTTTNRVRTSSPAPSAAISKPRPPSRLVASHVPTAQPQPAKRVVADAPTPPSAGSDVVTFSVDVPVSGSSTDGSSTSSKSDRTSTTRRTSVSSGDSPSHEDATKPAAPVPSKGKGKGKATPEPPVLPLGVPTVATVTSTTLAPAPGAARKRSLSGARRSSTDSDSEPLSKMPRVQGRTAGGARLSKPVKRSPTVSPARKPIELPTVEATGVTTAPPSRTSTPDPGAARAAVLGSITVKKRKLEDSPAMSRAPTPSMPSSEQPPKRHKSWDYSSSEDETPLAQTSASARKASESAGLGIRMEDRGRRPEAKALTSRRVAELAEQGRGQTSSRMSSPSPLPPRHPSLPAKPVALGHSVHKFAPRSTQEFLDLAERFAVEQRIFEDRRTSLAKRRDALREIVRRRDPYTRREGLVERVNRGDLQSETRCLRAQFDELAQIKSALQRYIADHPMA